MSAKVLRVPIALMLDPGLSPSAKLVWMALRLHPGFGPVGPGLLVARTGLSWKTVVRGLAHLSAAGWYSDAHQLASGASEPVPAGRRIPVPGDLLADPGVGIRGKLLYGCLQLLPQFVHPSGQYTYVSLSGHTGAGLQAVKRAVRDLVKTGWLHIEQKNQLAPIQFSLQNPQAARGKAEAVTAGRRLNKARFGGEALMREYLTLLVDSDDFKDNAAPDFLVNPATNERMELDRFYPPGVAFEFNGSQHYRASDRFSAESVAKQRARDFMKLGICVSRGITLMVIHAEDLTLETMGKKVGHLLPLRDLSSRQKLIYLLESRSLRYRLGAEHDKLRS